MIKRLYPVFIAILVFLTVFTSCDGDMFGNKEPVDIKLDKTLLEYETINDILGKNIQLSATITLKDGTTTTDVSWTVPEDISAFKVNSTARGVLTFQIMKAGTYVVRAGAKYKDEIVKTAACVITIKDALVSLDIIKFGETAFDSTTLNVGSSLDVSVIYTPTSTSQTGIKWNVANLDIATVTEMPNGRAIITGKAAGTTTVTARSTDNSKIYDSVTVVVQEAGTEQKFGVRSIEVDPSTGSLEVGKSLTLNATVLDGNANEITSGSVAFSIEGSGATLSTSSRSAVLTAVKGGDIVVHAEFTYDGATVTADVPIKIIGDVEEISPSSSYINAQVGDTETIEIAYNPSSTSRTGFNYTLSDQNVILVTGQTDTSLSFRVIGTGRMTITFTSKYDSSITNRVMINASEKVLENDRIQKVTLSTNSLSYYPPFQSGTISAVVHRRVDSGSVYESETNYVTWTSSDESVVTVTADTLMPNIAHVTPIKPGKATITATSKDNTDVSSSASVTVLGTLESLVPTATSINVPVGGTDLILFSPYPLYAIYTKPVVSLSNNNISADIGLRGSNEWGLHVTGNTTGSTVATIYVDGKKMTQVTINVYLPETVTVRNIELSETALSLEQDADPYYISASALDKDGAVLDKTIDFTPADATASRIASITRIKETNNFYVTPLNAGSGDYFFTVDGNTYASTRLHIEVGGSAVQGEEARQIRPAANSLTLTKGTTTTARINVIPLGADPGNITWSTSDLGIVSVTGNGTQASLWGISAGKATITAVTDSGLTTSFNVVVTNEATVLDTRVSYITISSGSDTSHIITSTLRRSLTFSAKSYTADGTEIDDTYTWTLHGDSLQTVQTSSDTKQFSALTKQYMGMDYPAVITATSNSNPNVSTNFLVYVASDTTVTEENPQILLGVTGVTLEIGSEKRYSFKVLPTTYYGQFNVTLSSDAVSVVLNSDSKTVDVTALHEGTSVLTISDGKASASMNITVVEKGQVIDSTITSITLDKSYLSYDLAQKAPQVVTATVYRNGIASNNESIIWSVENENLVGYTLNGKNSATIQHKNLTGNTVITATAKDNPDVSASCYIEIIDSTTIAQSLRYVMLSESTVALKQGESIRLTVSGQPTSALNQAEIRWSSNNDNIATVSNGKVTAVGEGVATITVFAEGLTDTCKVYVTADTVEAATPRNINLSSYLMNLSQDNMDKVYSINADIISATGSYITDRNVIWSVSDPNNSLEYTTSYNKITFSPRNAGTAVITASVDNVSTQAKIIVGATYVSDELSSIIIYPTKKIIEIGDVDIITANTIPSDNTDNIVWTTTTPSTIQITPNGKSVTIKGIKVGTTTLTAYSIEHPSVSRSMEVTVKEKDTIKTDEVTGIVLDKSSIVLDLNEKALSTIKATVYKDGKASTGKVIWTCDAGGLTAVQAVAGNADLANTVYLTKRAVGSGFITATSVDDPTFSASCHVQVIDSSVITEPTLLNAMISSTNISLQKGGSHQLSVTTIPGTLNADIIYSSSDETVATVSQTGRVTAMGTGKATIIAYVTYGEKIITLRCTVNVYENEVMEAYPSSIRFSENSIYLSQDNMDSTKTITATVYDSSYQEMNGATVYWEIDNPSVASIVKSGNQVIIAPLSAGRATIKATYRNISNTAVVIVGSPSSVLVTKTTGIAFDTSSAIMSIGEKKTVKASTIPVGVEDTIAYTVDNASVLRINRNYDGTLELEALSAGSARITATSVSNPTIKAQMNVTVRTSTTGEITAIELDKKYIALTIGDKDLTEVKATVYVDGVATKNVPITWSLEGLTTEQVGFRSSDTYGSSVYLTKKATGNGYLVASSQNGEVSARCLVEITEIQKSTDTVKYIRLSDSLMNLSQEKMDQTYTITASSYSATDKLLSRQVVWTVSNFDSAIEFQSGANSISFSPRNAGTAVITASVDNVSASARIIVGAVTSEVESTTISVVPENIRLAVGGEQTITASVLPVSSGTTVLWTTNTSGIVSIVPDGNNAKIKALSAGQATLTAWIPETNLSKSISVTVSETLSEAEVSSVVLDKSSLTFDLAEKNLSTLSAKVYKGSGISTGLVEWSMDESLQDVVSFSEIGTNLISVIKGTKTGSGYITATSKDDTSFFARCYIQVVDTTTEDPEVLLAANISSTTLSLGKGGSQNLSVQVLPATLNDYDVYWTSSDIGVATVNENGTVTAVSPGKATITAQVVKDGRVISLTCLVSVYANTSNAVTPAVITFSDNVIYLSQDDMDKGTEITAKILDSNYNEMAYTTVDSWSIEQGSNIVSLLSNGNTAVVYPLSAGSAIIKATYKNVENTFMVVVGNPGEVVGLQPKEITFSTDSIVIGIGDTQYVDAYVIPSGAPSDVRFQTDNPSIMNVSSSGNRVSITGLSSGTANVRAISVTDPTVYRSFKVTVSEEVTEETITSIVLDKTYISLTLDEKALTELKATAYKGNTAVQANIVWTLEGLDENQIGITPTTTGANTINITKKAAGNGYLVASTEDGSVYAKCYVEIKDATQVKGVPSRIILSQDMLTLSQEKMDEYTIIAASVIDSNGDTVQNNVTWTLSSPGIAKVAVNGNRAMVYPLSAGTTYLTASCGNASNSILIVVGDAYLEDREASAIVFTSEKALIAIGETVNINATVIPVSAPDTTVTWTGGSNIAEIVSTNGNTVTIKGLKAGGAYFTASTANGTITKVLEINVKDASDIGTNETKQISLDKSAITLDINEKASTILNATALLGGRYGDVTWFIDDSLSKAITYTDLGDNSISIVKKTKGSGYITAKSLLDSSFAATAYVEVIDSSLSSASLRFINLSEHQSAMEVGENTTLTVSGYPVSQFAGRNIIWTSSDPQVAVVSNGVVYGLGAGTATITATVEGTQVSDSCRITVYSDEIGVLAIRMNNQNITLNINEMFELGYTIIPLSATEHLVWTSSDQNIVQVDRMGVITAKSAGTATITVYDYQSGASATTNVEVLSNAITGSVTGITTNPATLTLRRGTGAKIRIAALPGNMSDTFSFGISDTNIADIDENNTEGSIVTIKGLRTGKTTLTITSNTNPEVSRIIPITVLTDTENVVTAVTVSKTYTQMIVGDLTEVTAKVYVDNRATTGTVLEWSTEGFADNVVKITPIDSFGTGVQISALSSGSGYVIARVKDGEEYARVFVEIKERAVAGEETPSSITLSRNVVYLSQDGSSQEVSALILGTNGSVFVGPVAWSTSDEDIFTIASAGNTAVLTPVSAGTAKLKAVYANVTAEAIVMVGRSAEVVEDTSIKAIALNPSRLTIASDTSAQTITAVVEPVSTTDTISWALSDPTVLTLTQNGRTATVRGLSSGTAVVTAYSSENAKVQDSIEVTVKPFIAEEEVSGIRLSRSSISLDLAEKSDVSVTATVYKGGKVSASQVDWTIDESLQGVVEVREAGNTISVVKKGVGSGYITATSKENNEFSAILYVEVIDSTTTPEEIAATLKDAVLTTTNATIRKGSTIEIGVATIPQDISDYVVVWSTGDETIASIDSNGLVTGNKAGSTYVRALISKGNVILEKRAVITVTEDGPTLTNIVLSDSTLILRINEAYTVTATPIPSDASTDFVWASSDINVAKVSQNGTITAVGPGNAQITVHNYTYDIHKSVSVQVLDTEAETAKASFIRLSVQAVELSQTDNTEKDVTASVIATDGYPLAGATVTWTLDKEGVASLATDGNVARLSALNSGKTNLRAWYGNLGASASVYVGVVPGQDLSLDHITTNPSVLTIETGKEGSITVTPYPAGNEISTVWQSADTSIASIAPSYNGKDEAVVVGNSQGNTVITVKDSATEKSATTTVRVRDDISAMVTGVTTDRSSLTINVNSSVNAQIKAKVYVANTESETEPLAWVLLDEDMEETEGLVSYTTTDTTNRTAVIRPLTTGKGYMKVYAVNDPEVYALVYINVIDTTEAAREITELRLEFDSITMGKGTTRKFNAVTLPTGIDADVRWSVENQSTNKVASVDIYGNVSALSVGNATVKAYLATKPTISDTVDLTVTEDVPSEYDIGSITITPSTYTLSQAASYPTSFTARIFDTSGKEIKNENVTWVTEGLGDVAEVVRTEGNVIYLFAQDAGKGELVAQKLSRNSNLISSTAFIYSGAVDSGSDTGTDPEFPVLTNLSFKSSSPVYLVLNGINTRTINLQYRPDISSLKGAVWSFANTEGYISAMTNDYGVTVTGIAKTEEEATITASSIATDENGSSLSATIGFRVVENEEDLPEVTTLVLDKNAVVLNLNDKADTLVRATAYDYYGNTVNSAVITWELEDNNGTDVSITNNMGSSTGINKGTKEGTVTLVAKCGEVEARCYVSIVNNQAFSGIGLSSDSIHLTVGGTTQITVFGNPESLFTGDVEYSIGGETESINVITTADRTRFIISAVQEGTATIRFRTQVNGYTYTADATILVNDVETEGVSRIILNPASAYLQVGTETTLTARLLDRKGNNVNTIVTFMSTDPSVASVASDGYTATVRGLKAGMTTIIARAGELEAQTFISVGEEASSGEGGSSSGTDEPSGEVKLVKIIPGMTTVSMRNNDRYTLNVSTVPSDYDGEISVASNRENIVTASVSGRELVLKAVGNGSAVVTVSSGSVMETISVSVTGTSEPAAIRFDKNAISLSQESGASERVTAKVYDSSDVLLATNVTDWSIDDGSIAKITDNGNGSVTVEPLNTGVTTVTARINNISSTFRVSVNEKVSAATSPLTIAMDTPSVRLSVSQSQLIGVLYQPNGLSEEAKKLIWSTSDGSVATVTPFGTTQALVEAKGIGSATITATSTTSPDLVSANMTVTVPDESTVQETHRYLIELDKKSIRLDKGTRTVIEATLYMDGEKIDASDIDWSFENNDSPMVASFVIPNGISTTLKASSAAILASSTDTGFAYVVASYNGATARAQVEVADLTQVEDTGLRAIVFSSSAMLMEVGESATLQTTVLPQVTGVSYVWEQMDHGYDKLNDSTQPYVRFITSKNGMITLEALRKGTVDIMVTAQLENYPAVTAKTTIEIVEEGQAEATYSYSSMKLDKTSLSLNQGADASYLTATLIDADGNETEDTVYGWRILNTSGEEVIAYNYWDYTKNKPTVKPYYSKLNAQSAYSFLPTPDSEPGSSLWETHAGSSGVRPSDIASDFAFIGSDHRMVRFVPSKAGVYFIEAYGPEENGVTVSARAIVYVSGQISDVSLGSNYIHMIKGDTQLMTASISPSTATLKDYSWKVSTEGAYTDGLENTKLVLSDISERSVIVTAKDTEGSSSITYTAVDVNGKEVSKSATITVHDASYGTGGIKRISFPSQFVTLGFPYTAQTYKASAYYMDNTTANDQNITYRVQTSANGEWNDLSVADLGTGSVKSGDTLIATFTVGNSGITVVPVNKGVFRILAELDKGEDGVFSSEMFVTVGGDSNTLTAASSSVVLYTGGSVDVNLSIDNPGYTGGLNVQILSETTADGYSIVDDRIVATGESMRSAFRTTTTKVDSNNVLTLGSKILVTNDTVRGNYDSYDKLVSFGLEADDFIGRASDEAVRIERILETFPRTAVVRVSTADGQSYADINVTIRRLPESNTYPVAIRLSQEKMDLNPPFNSEQSITATLLDQNGQETTGTIQWYLYPIGAQMGTELDKSAHTITDDIADYYFSDNTMYFTPKTAGLYRLTVKCTQNPQLSYTSTLNIAGDVTGVSASTGQTLIVAKNNSANISAVFTPTNALARDVVFTIDETVNGKRLAKLLNQVSVYDNTYIRISTSGNTATVTGLTGTSGNSTQRMMLVYAYDTLNQSLLNYAIKKGWYIEYVSTDTAGVSTFRFVDEDGNTEYAKIDNVNYESFKGYYATVNISVTVDKALYGFTTSSNRSIDPSVLENSRVTFDMSATSAGEGGSTVSPFSRWDWVECRIVGNESGEVYASSVPVTKVIDGNTYSLYDLDGDGVASDYFNGTDWVYGYNGNNGLYYNHGKELYYLDSELITDALTDAVLKSGGEYYYVTKDYAKKSVEAENVEIRTESAPLAIKAGDNSGKLDTDNGGSTWFFTLNTAGIDNETLRIVVRLRDDILYAEKAGKDPVALYSFDSEAIQVNASNLALTIGGKIQSLDTGMVIRENHGTTASETLTQNIDQIKLFEGASLTMIPTFNPSSTHEKNLEWSVRALDGGNIDDYITYSNNKNGSQFMITAKAFNQVSANDHRIIEIVARSVSDPSIFCRYEVDIQTMVKSLNFAATSLVQTNKNISDGVNSTPIYKTVASADSPVAEGDSDIFCFDTTDFSGNGGNIDAYYITYKPVPDYGYDFNIEIVNNIAEGSTAAIGEINTTGIEKETKAFRFVPAGRTYEGYDENGEGQGNYSVAYGDVTLRIYNDQINYSKEFTIHYQPANFRIVKYIEEESQFSGAFVPTEIENATLRQALDNNWDYIWNDDVTALNGLECIVLYPGESFDINMAGFAAGTKSDSAGHLLADNRLISYLNPTSISQISNTGDWVNTDENGDPLDTLQVSWKILEKKGGKESEELVSVWQSDTENRAKVTAAEDKYGIAYLQYEISYPIVDNNKDSETYGKVMYVETVDEETGETIKKMQKVYLTGGIPIYVISEVDQDLLVLADKALSDTFGNSTIHITTMIPENLSRSQRTKWFGVSSASKVNLENADSNTSPSYIFLGRAYASFFGTGASSISIGKVIVSSLDSVTSSIAGMQSEGYKGIALNLGTDLTRGLKLIDRLWSSSETRLDETIGRYEVSNDNHYVNPYIKSAKTFTDINLYDLKYMKWITSLSIDMTGLNDSEKSLKQLFAIDPKAYGTPVLGDFSGAGLTALAITGTKDSNGKGEDIGISDLIVPNRCSIDFTDITFSSDSNGNMSITGV